jgi:poly-gamma-glutamate synthesis protein (capsule biosynthesis protein)
MPLARLARLTAHLALIGALLLAACTAGDAAPTASPAPSVAPTGTATPPSEASPTPEAQPPIVIAAVGDLMFARDVVTLMQTEGVAYPFARVLPLLDGADLLVGNFEGTFTDRGEPLDKTYTFRAPPELAEGLAAAGFDLVNLANNHSADFGEISLLDTLDALAAVGVARFGAGLDDTEAYAATTIEVRGQRIAFLGFSDIGGAQPAAPGVPGVATAGERVEASIAAARAAADYVVVSFHWGFEYTTEVTERQRNLAHLAIDAGADVVLGHHPHILQATERYRDGLILYSLGNFVFDLDAEDLDTLGSAPFETAVAILTLHPDAPPALEIRPAFIDVEENRPRPATPTEAERIEAALTPLLP